MDRLTSPGRLAMIGVAGLAVTGLFTINFGPNAPSRLEKQVEDAARSALAAADAAYLTAVAHGQRIDLQGVVPSAGARDAAVRAVRASLGSGGLIAGGVSKVTTQRLDIAALADPFTFSAIRTPDGIELTGVAPSHASRTTIEKAAGLLFGDAPVTSRIDLAFGAPAGVAWDIAVIQGLEALSRMGEGSTVLTGSRLVVRGAAQSKDAAGEIAIKLMLAGGGITTDVLVTGPPEWTATLADGHLVLGGHARSDIAGGALLRTAQGVFDGKIDNQMSPGEVGGWQARALLALPHFTRFSHGELSVRGEVFTISGEAPASVLSYLREDMERLPDDGYRLEWNVTDAAIAIPEIEGLDLAAASGEAGREVCEQAFAKIMAANSVLFVSGGTGISRDSGQTLDKLAQVARACTAFQIEVQGHTDNRGGRAANLRLSRARADAVRTWLVGRGLEADRLTAAGYGPDRPEASNRNETGRARNRRIEFRVSAVESP